MPSSIANPVPQTHNEEYTYWTTEDGHVLIWDDPTIHGGIRHPVPYKPMTSLPSVLAKFERGFLNKEDVMILKVLGDAICANENQLRRYMSLKMSPSYLSKRLKRFRELGLVDRWFVDSDLRQEGERKPPAPFTLGVSGYILLKHLYNEDFFMDPQRWYKLGVRAVQRYVAMNEIRCQLVERRALKSWKWSAVINNNPHLTRPLGVAEVSTPKGNVNLVIERTQQSKDFIGFLAPKFKMWEKVYETFKYLPIKGMDHNQSVVVVYCSTRSMAEVICQELLLDQNALPIWFCIEEYMVEKGLGQSFYLPAKEGLKRINLDFLV